VNWALPKSAKVSMVLPEVSVGASSTHSALLPGALYATGSVQVEPWVASSTAIVQLPGWPSVIATEMWSPGETGPSSVATAGNISYQA
jgi:hypothetical protein